MKNFRRYSISSSIMIIGVLVLMMIQSCKKDFLDNENRGAIAGDTQWSDESSADLFLNDIYGQLNHLGSTPDPLDSFTDDNDGGPYWKSWRWRQGIIGPGVEGGAPMNNDGFASNYTNWSSVYSRIRRCNTFIMEINAHASNYSEVYRKKRIGEARFLRAFFYSYLWMHVGGLAIITEPQDRNTSSQDELYKSRSTFEETFDFINAELDAVVAEGALEVKYNGGATDAGRATIGAALALKGWTELFAASPAFNSGSPVMGPDPDRFYSFASSDPARYARAAATNKKFIDTYGANYNLYPDLTTIFSEPAEYNSEIIWDRQAIRNTGGTMGSDINLFGGPVFVLGQYYTWGNYNPTQELVDDFRMSNGLPIDAPGSGYDPQKPYVNREQRFYDWIVYDGAPYKQNWMPSTDIIYTRIDKVNPSKNEIDFGSSDVTNTGYYFKKRLNPDMIPSGDRSDGQNYVYFRFAEVLLNYAEAQNEAVGPDASVYEAVNRIRTRAKLPTLQVTYGGALSQIQMREVIRNERRVELCFENKRWYDLVRWRIAEDVLSKDFHGMKITNTVPSNNSGQWKYEVVPLNHPHVFTPNMYLNPIPQNVIDQNPKIKQNPNY